MEILQAHDLCDCIHKIRRGADIVILVDGMSGLFVFATNREAMEILFKNNNWSELDLGSVPRFFFPDVTKPEFLAMISEIAMDCHG